MQNMAQAGQAHGAGAPGQVQWMARPGSVPNCPPGLEYLTQIDQVLVHQQVELLEGELLVRSLRDYNVGATPNP